MIALLIALGVTAASVHADTELRLGTIGGLISADTAKAGDTIKIGIDWVNRNAVNYNPSMAFRIFSRSSFDGGDYGSGTATWISVAQVNTPPYYTLSTLRPRVGPQVDTSGGLPKPQFGAVYIFNCFGCEGSGVDTIAFAGAANDPDNQTAIPAMDSGLAVTLVVVTQLADTGKVICIDSSSNFPPTNTWKWAGYIPPGQPNEFPVWAGIKCWVLKNPAPSGVNDVTDGELPTKFDLRQNYPNPFNPSTKIEFDVPRKSHVTLTVYNVLGQAVNTLVNEEMTPGNKVVIWDGDSQTGVKVSSGMYFYKLSADGFLSTKKMLLVK
jgi:hypothetical protein